MYDAVLVKYAELALKGQNRSYFEKKLAENIKRAFKKNKIKYEKVARTRHQIMIYTKEDEEKLTEALKNVFGIANFSFAYSCEKDLEKIKKLALSKANFYKKAKTFKVDASRQDKSFKTNSMEIGRIIGEVIYNKYRIKGDMKNPEAIVHIDISDKAYVYFNKIHGLDNLPVGSGGKTICLLSGGIDSAAAAWLAMKRGCYVTYVHFYKSEKLQKIKKIVKILNKYQTSSKIYFVPFHRFQLASSNVYKDYEMILFRRFMVKVAEKIAQEERANAIVFGDNLGQVASQTLNNLNAIEHENNKLIILRPLLCYSKQEIIDMAKKIGTYEASILPYNDCCSIVSQHPSMNPHIDKILEFEKTIQIDKIIEKTMKDVRSEIIK